MRNVVVTKTSPLMRLYMLPPIVKLLLAFTLLAISCIVGFMLLLRQSDEQVKVIQNRSKALEAEVTKEAKSAGELSYVPKSIVEGKQKYDTLLKEFPPESKIAQLLESITKLGTEDGLKFVYFRPNPVETFDFYATVPVDIAVTGHFHQIGKFLSGLANLPGSVVAVNQFIMVRNPDLSLKNDQNNAADEVVLSLRFKATLYYTLPTSSELPS